MAVITPSALISEIRGSVGQQTFSRNRYGPMVRQKLVQTNPNTPDQQAVRQVTADAVAEWQAMTQEQQEVWMNFANANIEHGNISRKYKLAGYNEFIRRCLNRYAQGGSATGFQPLPKVRIFPIITAVTQGIADISIHFDTLTPIGNCDLVVYATPPISPGINEVNPALLRVIGTITPAAQISSANIYSAYTARYSLTVGDIGKKIGIAIRAVNTDNFAGGRFFFAQIIIGASLIVDMPQVEQNIFSTFTSGNNVTVTPVNPIMENSLIVVIVGHSSAVTVTAPAGFTLNNTVTSGTHSIRFFSKIATASEPSSYTFTLSGASFRQAWLAEITMYDTSNPHTTIATGNNANAASVLVSSSFTANENDLILLIGGTRVGAFATTFSTWATDFFPAYQRGQVFPSFGEFPISQSGLSAVYTFGNDITQNMTGILIRINPVP